MKLPFQTFIEQALKDFEQHLKTEGMKESTTIDSRMRGAREFAFFLIGQPHRKGERTKGKM